MKPLILKVSVGLLLIATLFVLVLLGKWTAEAYAALIVPLIVAWGAHVMTAWQPPSKEKPDAQIPAPPAGP